MKPSTYYSSPESLPVQLPRRKFFNTINAKLNTIFVTIVTLVLAVTGAMNFFATKFELINAIEEHNQQLQARLQVNVARALWDLQNDSIAGLLEAEMADPDLSDIIVTAQDQFIAGYQRNKSGALEKLSETIAQDQTTNSFELLYHVEEKDNIVGKIIFSRSPNRFNQELEILLGKTLLQIFLADFVLIIGLSLALRFLVVRPIDQTQKALNQIAAGDADLTFRLDAERNDEIGAMAQGFNLFTTGLQKIIGKIQESAVNLSSTAQQMTNSTEQIYHALQKEKTETANVANDLTHIAQQSTRILDHTHCAVETTHSADEQIRFGQGVVNDGISLMIGLRQDIEQSTQIVQS